jgi:hypothetical protein
MTSKLGSIKIRGRSMELCYQYLTSSIAAMLSFGAFGAKKLRSESRHLGDLVLPRLR